MYFASCRARIGGMRAHFLVSMPILMLLALSCAALLPGSSAFAQAISPEDVYVSTKQHNIYRVHPETGTATFICKGGHAETDIALSPNGIMYALDGDYLYTIDIKNPVHRNLGTWSGLVCPSSFRAYIRIDLPYPEGESVGITESMEFSPDGNLYIATVSKQGWTYNRLYKLNPYNGVATYKTHLGGCYTRALAFHGDQWFATCGAGANTNTLAKIDPNISGSDIRFRLETSSQVWPYARGLVSSGGKLYAYSGYTQLEIDVIGEKIAEIKYLYDALSEDNKPPQIFGSTRLPKFNEKPTANAGPDQAIRPGNMAYLDGSASFDDNTASEDLVYAWTVASVPNDCAVVPTFLFDDTPNTSFVADCKGTYVVQLVVTDSDGVESLPDQAEVSSDNLAPTADAGMDQLVIIWDTVSLDGKGSHDPETDPLTFSWTITSAPAGSEVTLHDSNTQNPTFAPDLEGTYEVTLEVSDPIGPGTSDTVEILATTAEGYAEIKIVSVDATVTNLDPDKGEVTTEGNQTAYGNFLRQSMAAIQEGDLEEAIDKLQKAIKRADGCVLRGAADGNGPERDWVTDCTAQQDVYHQLNDALTALTS